MITLYRNLEILEIFSILMLNLFIEVVSMVKVVLKGIALDNMTGMPIVLLMDEKNQKDIYPILIGVAEAEGILLNQSGLKPPRPLTYDLFKDVIEALGGRVSSVEIVDKIDNGYIANLTIEVGDKKIKVDSRPSDAINLALRFGAPIFLNEDVVQKVSIDMVAQVDNQNQPEVKNIVKQESQTVEFRTDAGSITDDDLERFKKMLEDLKPDDFLLNKGETV